MKINKSQNYKAGNYSFRNFISLSDIEKEKVWSWRNEESIRRFMYNKEIIPLEDHLKFIEGLSERDDVYYWIVEKEGEIVGVTNLTSVDLKNSRAELGYYMVPEMQKKGIGIDFAYNNFVFAFCGIGVETLFGGIDKRNINAVTLDSYLGCVLNKEDIENLESIEYIRWEVKQKDFIADMEGKNDFRNFVRYTREKKDFFERIKRYAY